jgi:hypothetical protein
VDGDLRLDIVAGVFTSMVANITSGAFDMRGGLVVFSATHVLLWNSSGWGASMVLGAQNMDTDAYMEGALVTISSATLGGPGTNQSNVTVIEWMTGSFYRQGELAGNTGTTISAFDIADITNDNNKELVIGTSEDDGSVYTGTVTAYSPSMSQLWKSGNIGGVLSLKVADVDTSADLEILAGVAQLDEGDLTGCMIVYSSTYTEIWRTPNIGFVQSIGIGDPNKDGITEILAGAAYYSDSSSYNNASYNGTIHVYSGLTRQELSNQTGFHEFSTQFILFDADKNGIQEILFAEWLEDALQGYIRLYHM